MANLASSVGLILTISCLLVSTLDVYARKLRSGTASHLGEENIIKLHFYVHDLSVSHDPTTTYDVATASISDSSPTHFGTVRVIDDLVTETGNPRSKAMGRMQGLVTKSDLSVLAMSLNLNFYFTEGRFAGSTLSILGRNQIGNDQRELPVVGGTGFFRYSRGYAIQTTYAIGNEFSVLEFNVWTTYTDESSVDSPEAES